MTFSNRYIGIVLASLFIAGVFVPARYVSAASLSLGGTQDAATGLIAVDVVLDTGGTQINAASGVIRVDGSKVALYSVDETRSLISLWVDRPHMIDDHTIVFSGIIPSGFSQLRNQFSGFPLMPTVVRLLFRAQENGTTTFSVTDSHVLLNDGRGTEVPLTKVPPLTLSVVRHDDAHIDDTIAPDSFTPVLAKSPTLFDGRYFLTFSTRDIGTGIDHYEVQEGEDGQWVSATSPYVIADQSLRKDIRVAAVDGAGNRTVVSVAKLSISDTALSFIFIGLFLASLVLLWLVIKHYGFGIRTRS